MRLGRTLLLLGLWVPLIACGGSYDMGAKSGGAAPVTAMAAPMEPMTQSADADQGPGRNEFAGGRPAPPLPDLQMASKKAPDKAPDKAPPSPAAKDGNGGASATGAGPNSGEGSKGTDDRRSPILIYKADFTMSVYEVQKSIDAVEALSKKAGGYLARRDDASITIRVPAGEFQNAVVDLSKLGDVLNRNVVAEDVTGEYRDLEVQLQNNLALRDRYAKLLDKAQKVEEALQIEQELGRITGEIERIKGRLKLLTELAQYSTITVRFAPRVDQQVQGGPFVLPLPWLGNLGLPRLLQLR